MMTKTMSIEEQNLLKDTALLLQGSAYRCFIARVVNLFGWGGQSFAENNLGWNRGSIRKGQKEYASGIAFEDHFNRRGRGKVEEKLPNLLDDIRSIVEPLSQTDPTFRSTRIYSPMSANEIHLRLIKHYKYKKSELPCIRTIRTKLQELGYYLKKVRKCLPLKKIKETDDIFDEVHKVNKTADETDGVLRISLDTKATVKIGGLSRGGSNRQGANACDHDFEADAKLVPFGILLPHNGKSHLWFSESKVTADFMVDQITTMIPRWKKEYNCHTLVINADNGPECSGRRTQWLKRMVELADRHQVTIQLAYYPPYHSKYNPVERLWGVLENHWRGEIIDSINKALGLARSMTYRSLIPTVRKVSKIYQSGVKVAKNTMENIEARLERKKGLEKWSIKIKPQPG